MIGNKSKIKSPALLFLCKISWNLWPDSSSLNTWIWQYCIIQNLSVNQNVTVKKNKQTKPHKLFILFALHV